MVEEDFSGTRTRPRILLAEDSQTSKAMLLKNLSENYELIEARDGEEAWQILLADERIDVVITDVNMPRLTGQQLLVKIRKSQMPRIANIPVIVMTAANDSVDKNLAFLNGANDFLMKPVDVMELQARVNVHYKLTRTIRELEESRRALAEQASTDPLTRLRNRRSFYDQGAQHISAVKRYLGELSVLLIDIDHFKQVNDRFGHQAGDEVLLKVATLLAGIVRNGDVVGRIGGEEFAALLPETNRLGAAVLAERVRARIEKAEITAADTRIRVTVSIGMATFSAESVDSFDELLAVADRRLYLAKNQGRNRICVNDEGKTSFA